jgi:serine acetyltransferase
MRLILFRILLKLGNWMRSMAVRHTPAVRSSRGLDGVVRLLRVLDGEDAIAVLRTNGAQIGAGTRLLPGMVVQNAERDFANLRVGQGCHLGSDVLLDLAHPIRIGDRVTISMRTMLITHTNVGDSRCGLANSGAAVEIADDVYIGAGAIVLPGVRLGTGAVIGAGAVVNRDAPPGSRMSGVPARPHTSHGSPSTGTPPARRPSAGDER